MHKIVDGVDVNRLSNTVDVVKDEPDMARFRFRAHNRWISGAHSRTVIDGFYGAGHEDKSREEPFVLEADEPSVLLGEDRGANATEMLLHALASCLSTTFIYHAAEQGIEIDELEFEVEGDLDLHGFLGLSDNGSGFERIRVTCWVKADAPWEKLEELFRMAQKMSPVFSSVTHPTPVSVRMEMK